MIRRKWNKDEEEFLKKHYLRYSYKEIGMSLGRSFHSVNRKAQSWVPHTIVERLKKIMSL